MSSVRRKTIKISPISVVRSSPALNAVTSIAAVDSLSFSDVLVKALTQSLSNGNSDVLSDAHRTLVRSDKADAHAAESVQTEAEQKAMALPAAWSPFAEPSSDLCMQLETLLREKSLLIAVA